MKDDSESLEMIDGILYCDLVSTFLYCSVKCIHGKEF